MILPGELARLLRSGFSTSNPTAIFELILIMKSKLAYVVLFSVFGLAGVAAAETAGVATASIAYAIPFSVFITALVLLTLGADYGRSLKPLPVPAAAALLTPADEAFAQTATLRQHPAARRRAKARRVRSLAPQG